MKNKKNQIEILRGNDEILLKDIKWRRENREWLKKSRAISFKILETLREIGMSQKELANKIGVKPQQVSKWVKGKENFQLDTITSIEKVLNTKLILVSEDTIKTA